MTIRWGILGCGDVTEKKSGPAFQKCDGSELVAVMRRDGARAADYAKRHGVPRWTNDAQQLIDDPEVDAVYIATPPGSHRDYALRVAAAGKPCYVEKPMARSVAECRAMVEAFEQAGQPLLVAYYRRELPRFKLVERLLSEGAIGEVAAVDVRLVTRPPEDGDLPWRLQAEHAGGGRFLDLASHTLDVLDLLLGEIGEVKGVASNVAGKHDVEDTVSMNWRTDSTSGGGIVGSGLWCFAGSVSDDIIRIEGDGGRIELSCFGTEPVRLLRQGTEPELLDVDQPEHVQQPLIQTIVDQLRGQGTCRSTGRTAERTSRVMDDALRDYYAGRDDAFWDRPNTWPGRPV